MPGKKNILKQIVNPATLPCLATAFGAKAFVMTKLLSLLQSLLHPSDMDNPLSGFSLDQRIAMAYDRIAQSEVIMRELQMINTEIAARNTAPVVEPKKKTKGSTKKTEA